MDQEAAMGILTAMWADPEREELNDEEWQALACLSLNSTMYTDREQSQIR